MVFNDQRRFGFIKYFEKIKINENKIFRNLGPEPLSKKFNYQYVYNIIKKRKVNIKCLLMNQNFESNYILSVFLNVFSNINEFLGNNFYFIRAKIYDKPGAIAAITTILKNSGISIKSLFQEQLNKKMFNVVILTHRCKKNSMDFTL